MSEELRREILELVFMLLGQLGKSRRWVRIIIVILVLIRVRVKTNIHFLLLQHGLVFTEQISCKKQIFVKLINLTIKTKKSKLTNVKIEIFIIIL